MTDTRPEYRKRVANLIAFRGMSDRAARIVVDAAMYGKGCVEGKVREDIERKKKEPLSEEKGLTK